MPAHPRVAHQRPQACPDETPRERPHPVAVQSAARVTGARELPAQPHLLHVDEQLRIEFCPMPGPSVVRLAGQIDASNAAAVAETLGRALRIDDDLVADVSGLTFVSVAGLRALTTFDGAGIRLEGVPPGMLRLLDVVCGAAESVQTAC